MAEFQKGDIVESTIDGNRRGIVNNCKGQSVWISIPPRITAGEEKNALNVIRNIKGVRLIKSEVQVRAEAQTKYEAHMANLAAPKKWATRMSEKVRAFFKKKQPSESPRGLRIVR